MVHSGDLMNSGWSEWEITDFCKWFASQDYDAKVFIAGNHDHLFEKNLESVMQIVNSYDIDYLQDSEIGFGRTDGPIARIWGSPWQPWFHNWAFNLPRDGEELKARWDLIPESVDLLITHGPPMGHLDVSGSPWFERDLGCRLLRERVDVIKPKIHVFGHIHGSYGYKFHNGTHFINASVLDERYQQVNKPIIIDWDPITNEIEFIKYKL